MIVSSLQPRFSRHWIGLPQIDFRSLVQALYGIEEGISRGLYQILPLLTLKGRNHHQDRGQGMLVLFISLNRDLPNVIRQLHRPQELTLSSSTLVYTTCSYSAFCSNISIFCISIAMFHQLGYIKALCFISQAQNSIGSYFFLGDTIVFSIWHAIEPSFLEAGRDWIIDSLSP